MAARSPARYLAPIALVATIAAVYVVVNQGAPHHAPITAGRHRGSAKSTSNGAASTHNRSTRTRVHVVQPGDSLSTIAARAHVPLAAIEALNPGVNPNTLQSGQRIRLPQ